jgi:hypothetical protein
LVRNKSQEETTQRHEHGRWDDERSPQKLSTIGTKVNFIEDFPPDAGRHRLVVL